MRTPPALLASGLLVLACANGANEFAAIPGVQASMNFEDGGAFYDAPFPGPHRLNQDGSLRVSDFPGAEDNPTLSQVVKILSESRGGFSLNGGVFIRFDGAINVSNLPTPATSLQADSPVFLVNVSPESPRFGERIAIEPAFKGRTESYSPRNLLVVLPFQGFVMEPNATYAAVVLRSLGDAQGRPLGSPRALEQLKGGINPFPSDRFDLAKDFELLWRYLDHARIDRADVAAAAVFKTGDPFSEMRSFRDQIAAMPTPAIEQIKLHDKYAFDQAPNDAYCAVSARTRLPVFQKAPKPYLVQDSGYLVTDAEGNLVAQEEDDVEIILTIPKGAMPPNGWPIVLYGNGGGGKASSVLDRTAEARNPDEGKGPRGDGPARYLANRGVASLGVPAPLAWDRHPSRTQGGKLDFWNTANFHAFRDNVRQGALDFTTTIKIAKAIRIPKDVCDLAETSEAAFRYDPSQIYFYGHSTGSTLGGISVPLEPDYKGGMVSGAGGSWIYNLVYAESPFPLKAAVSALLEYKTDDEVDIHDPPITFFQTVMEETEVMNWAPHIARRPFEGQRPKPFLLMEGVIDTYHFPRMVNALGMASGFDLAGPTVEPSAEPEYLLVGGKVLSPPVTDNLELPDGGRVTGITLQHLQREGVDGHHVPFEFEAMKYSYSCFIQSIVRTGRATLVRAPENSNGLEPCP